MYCDYFGLREQPFNNTPDPHFFYPTPDHEEALATLMYGVSRYKGFLMLSGEVGTGKTLVSRVMLNKFGDSITFANLANTYVSPIELLQAICDEFQINYSPDGSSLQLSKLLEHFLLDQFSRNTPVVLVVDEAQNLPHETFEQLRMIGNLESDDAKLLQIVMVGQCELRARFQKPELRQLRQRIFRSYHLPALGRKACEGYIEHRLMVAGHPDGRLFPADAIDSITAFSKGLPRAINNICDNTLLAAYSDDRPITQGLVRTVMEEMMTLEFETQTVTPDASRFGREPHRPSHGAQPEIPATLETSVPGREEEGLTTIASVSTTHELPTQQDSDKFARTHDHGPVDAGKPPVRTTVRSAGTPSTGSEKGLEAGDPSARAQVINNREQRILNRLAAISRDIERDRMRKPGPSEDLRRKHEPLRLEAVEIANTTVEVPVSVPNADGLMYAEKRVFDAGALAGLRKSIAECRLALHQLASLDGPSKLTAAKGQPHHDELSYMPVLALQPSQPWLVGV